MQHLHMRQCVARPGQECKSELIIGAEELTLIPRISWYDELGRIEIKRSWIENSWDYGFYPTEINCLYNYDFLNKQWSWKASF